jgi:hypothetical protein
VLGVLFAAGLALSMLGSSSDEVPGSAASSAAGGRRALLLVLEELGVPAEPWRGAPARLPRGEHLLWMARTPVLGEASEGGAAPVGGEELDPRDPRHLAGFVRQGGTLLLPATREGLTWLREQAGLPVPAWPDLALPEGETLLRLDDGGELRLVMEAERSREVDRHGAEGAALDPAWRVLAALPGGAPFAAVCELEGGQVALIADDGFLRNGRLGEGDHGLLAATLVARLAPTGRVLFDEFALGRWLPMTRLELLATPGVRLAALHALLLGLVYLWHRCWPREFPRDGVAPALDPRQRAQARAALLERAGAHELLAEELRAGVLRRLAARVGLRTGGAAGPRPAEELVELLRARHPVLRDDPRWARLAPAPVQGHRDLEQLGRDLAALERDLQREARDDTKLRTRLP